MTDASVILELLIGGEAQAAAAERLFDEDESWHAPHLIDLEVAQVLRRYERAGEMGDRRAREALADLSGFPIERYPHEILVARIWQLRHGLTAYDAAYVALAEGLGAPLLTCDARLARSIGHAATVELLA